MDDSVKENMEKRNDRLATTVDRHLDNAGRKSDLIHYAVSPPPLAAGVKVMVL